MLILIWWKIFRFRHPKPIRNWDGIKNVTGKPNSCVQIDGIAFPGHPGKKYQQRITRLNDRIDNYFLEAFLTECGKIFILFFLCKRLPFSPIIFQKNYFNHQKNCNICAKMIINLLLDVCFLFVLYHDWTHLHNMKNIFYVYNNSRRSIFPKIV